MGIPILLLEKRKNPLILTIIALLGLFLTETSDLLASDAENKIGKYQRFKAYKDITRFESEILYYDISFLWFDNAASAKVQFLKGKGNYYSTLEASTKGFVGFFTSYRKHYYKTEFKITNNGKSVRPTSFPRQFKIGDQAEIKLHQFN
jgi:hypothetical protein